MIFCTCKHPNKETVQGTFILPLYLQEKGDLRIEIYNLKYVLILVFEFWYLII